MEENKEVQEEIKEEPKEEVKVVNTDTNSKNGENRCPECGASDVTYNIRKKKLVCNYCATEFDPENIEGLEKDLKNLEGETRTTGVKDIDKDANDVITLKCGGCGAEVVINTREATNARCHWCRSILSINSQIENGAVPDLVLPFGLEKKNAQEKIENFVSKRQFFAHPTFKKEFTTENIMGVYFPYLLVDANCSGKFAGEGGHVAREYTITKRNSKGEEEKETVYDIDLYDVERDFDITIDDLTVESSKDKLDKNNKNKTTNVINAIMPFDTENCVKYKANYLVGYSSEKRDINISNIEEKVDKELQDVGRHALNADLKFYDSGVEWNKEDFKIKGKQWVSAYLPVWLYSYQDPNKILHYVAVNARTGETMGSVPMNKKRLWTITILIFILFLIIALFAHDKDEAPIVITIVGLVVSLVFYGLKVSKYRNKGARHTYELETKHELKVTRRVDNHTHTKRECSSRYIAGANNKMITGEYTNIKE